MSQEIRCALKVTWGAKKQSGWKVEAATQRDLRFDLEAEWNTFTKLFIQTNVILGLRVSDSIG